MLLDIKPRMDGSPVMSPSASSSRMKALVRESNLSCCKTGYFKDVVFCTKSDNLILFKHCRLEGRSYKYRRTNSRRFDIMISKVKGQKGRYFNVR